MFTIGADPEIFLTKNGEAVSAYGVIPGTKKKPHPVVGGAIQVDGMAVEFNIDPVDMERSSSAGEFVSRIKTVIAGLASAVAKKDRELTFNISPVQEFSEEVLSSQPDAALELGCDPDYNAYTLLPNPTPDAGKNFRTGAGHVHFGWGAGINEFNPDHIQICADFVKALDMTVGMFMTIIDKDDRRRELYGRAGAFRPKSYGVEYRTPSNEWLKDDERMSAIFQLGNAAIQMMKRGSRDTFGDIMGRNAEDVINQGDYNQAYSFLYECQRRDWLPSSVWKTIKKEFELRAGVTKVVKKASKKSPTDIYTSLSVNTTADAVWIAR